MKIQKFFIAGLLIFLPSAVFAEILINEIMYDVSGSDSGREWIEITNTGPGTVDISSFKFLESSAASNHGLTLIQGTANLPQSGLAVIVSDSTKFLIDWPSFSGNLFKASFSSINNTSGNLIIKDGDLVVQNEAAYNSSQGANGDGNSLQRSGSSWISSVPTPGIQNSGTAVVATTTTTTTTTSTTSGSTSNSATSAHSSPAILSNSEEEITFEISAGRDRLATVGNSITFIVKSTKLKNLPIQGVTYSWSFGDGTTQIGNIVDHTYKFAGEYVVIVNAQVLDEQAVSRIKVNAVAPSVSLNKVEGGVELHNKSQSEINLEDWVLYSVNKSFTFPKDTLIPANKKVIFSDEITGIVNDVELRNPIGKSIALIKEPTQVFEQVEVASTSQIEINKIQSKIDELKIELKSELAKREKKEIYAPLIVVEEEAKPSELVVKEVDTSQVSNVFEAEKKSGVISRVFAIPIKGINWITRLFVEE